MSDRLILGTRKGTFILEKKDGRWQHVHRGHGGANIAYAAQDPRTGTIWSMVDHGHWGSKVSHSKDGGKTWEEAGQVKYPEGARHQEFAMSEPPEGEEPPPQKIHDSKLLKLWYVEFGTDDQPGRLYIGTIPGGLFVSDDDGKTWELNRPLWNHESRGGDLFDGKKPTGPTLWFGTPASMGTGEFAAGICSILPNAKDGNHLRLAVGCAGAIETKDGGETWSGRNKGMIVDFLPNKEPEWGHDIHFMAQCRNDPKHVWHQNHVGVYYSDNGMESWKKVDDKEKGVHFGWPVCVDENDGKTAWLVPQRGDNDRTAINEGLFVARSTDGGASWEQLREGLPQEHCYDTVYRHAFHNKEGKLAFGSTNGNLYISEDRGDSWHTVGNNLPPIHSVRFA